ncbi:MAG: hypothetical protein QXI42_10925 [Thermoproteota archaeon]
MGQFSAELNSVRRLERYEEEVEERILRSENWKEELERYLEGAMEEWDEGPEDESDGTDEGFPLMMEGNLSEDERREIAKRMEEENKIVTSEGLVLLQGSKEEEERVEALETEDPLRELIGEIEALAEGDYGKGEKLENIEEELREEEKRQEELYRDELFEAIARKVEAEAESEGFLEKLLEKSAESKEIEERIERSFQRSVEHEKPEEEYEESTRELEEEFVGYEEPIEEYDVLEEKFEELMGGEETLEEAVEDLEEVEEVGEEEALEEEVEEPIEEVVEEVEEAEERSEELAEGFIEEVEDKVEEPVEELAEEVEVVEEERALEEEEVAEEVAEETEGKEEETEEVEEVEEGEKPHEGLRMKCVLKKEGNRFRIYMSEKKELLESYLGNETCWVKIEVKSRIIYKKYDPSTYRFNFPMDIGEDGEEIEVTIVKITTYEFIKTVLKEASAPFDIAFDLEEYKLIVNGKEVCDLTLKDDMYYDDGDHGPAVKFTIRDYEGKEHLIKLVYKESKEYLCKAEISANDYEIIENVKYEDGRRRLIILYRKSGRISGHEVRFEKPRTVLRVMVKELGDMLKSGTDPDDPRLKEPIGDIGEGYTRFYREEAIKEKVSRETGIPKEKLKVVQGDPDWGPDFYVYYKGGLVAIVEVKTTTKSERYPGYSDGCLYKAKRDLMKYFKEDFGNVKYGVRVAVYLRDLDKILETEFKEGIECTIDVIQNSKYRP